MLAKIQAITWILQQYTMLKGSATGVSVQGRTVAEGEVKPGTWEDHMAEWPSWERPRSSSLASATPGTGPLGPPPPTLGLAMVAYKENTVTQEWEMRAKNLLKGELKRRGITCAQLADLLKGLDIHETDRNLNNKISRGGFTAAFLLQCLNAVGAKSVNESLEQ